MKSKWLKQHEVKDLIGGAPESVVRVSVLEDRVNVGFADGSGGFLCAMPADNKRYVATVNQLVGAAGTFVVVDRRGGVEKKTRYVSGVAVDEKTRKIVRGKDRKAPAAGPTPAAVRAADAPAAEAGRTVSFGGVLLPVRDYPTDPNVAAYIPEATDYAERRHEVRTAAAAIANAQPVLFEGHTGAGKTELVKHLAARTGNPLLVIEGSEDMEVSTLLGHMELDATGTFWVDGLLAVAAREGYWVYLDEVNAIPPGVKLAIHNLLDDGRYLVLADHRGERVKAHPDFRLVAACNPADHPAYVGAGQENGAFLNRFSKVAVDYMDSGAEISMLVRRHPHVPAETTGRLVAAANMVRAKFRDGSILSVITTRDLKALCANLRFLELDEALTMVLGKFAPEDGKVALDLLEQQFSRLAKCRKLLGQTA